MGHAGRLLLAKKGYVYDGRYSDNGRFQISLYLCLLSIEMIVSKKRIYQSTTRFLSGNKPHSQCDGLLFGAPSTLIAPTARPTVAPSPPAENWANVPIQAGEKDFKK